MKTNFTWLLSSSQPICNVKFTLAPIPILDVGSSLNFTDSCSGEGVETVGAFLYHCVCYLTVDYVVAFLKSVSTFFIDEGFKSLIISGNSLKNADHCCLLSSGIGSSQSSFSLVAHKCRIKILARPVKGPASPRASYILLTCENIIRFVSGGVSFESLLALSFYTPRFRFEKKLSFAEKHK